MLGLAQEEIIKHKEYINCYGIGQGAYLIGQNGNDPKSAILFHHSNNIYNRKEIVCWNYREGDVINVSVMREGVIPFLAFKRFFRKDNGKVDMQKI